MNSSLFDLIVVDSDEPAMVCHVGGDLLDVDDPVVDGMCVELRVPNGPAAIPSLMRALDGANVNVHAIDVRRPGRRGQSMFTSVVRPPSIA